MTDVIVVIDFGSQYSQLIARRIREMKVYSEILTWDAPVEKFTGLDPKGYILSGGPDSVYAEGAPQLPAFLLETSVPILGICYGIQALTQSLGGVVAASEDREFGMVQTRTLISNPLLPDGEYPVWMSHGDRIETVPPGFKVLARSTNSPVAAIGHVEKRIYGLQFHPEVRHTPDGFEILRRFVVEICGARQEWTPQSIIEQMTKKIRQQVGKERVLAGVSGGVDSSVAAALVYQAIGDQLAPVFVENGLLRLNERQYVEEAFRKNLGAPLVVADASQAFLGALNGVSEPERKRHIIGETFIRVFEQEARRLGSPRFLVQGTIYPDVVESSAPDAKNAHRIKSHHNVGGLPKDLSFELVEPLRYLFKDEVRAVGEALGLPAELVWRQPFPGPGLAVRCLGDITPQRLEILRNADAVFTGELEQAGLLGRNTRDIEGIISQAFAVLLPVRSVGVMGDQRTYQEVIALRAVTTDDFMTADWARLPADLLARTASRIVNEIGGVNRVVYDITSKPPATIEWE